jgi:GAF domain-containing protein
VETQQLLAVGVSTGRRRITARPRSPLTDLVRSAGISAYACEPLIVGDQPLGTLSFASRTRRSFDAEDILFFRAIARHVAMARNSARDRALLPTAAD